MLTQKREQCLNELFSFSRHFCLFGIVFIETQCLAGTIVLVTDIE
jgi:hypothetical protein